MILLTLCLQKKRSIFSWVALLHSTDLCYFAPKWFSCVRGELSTAQLRWPGLGQWGSRASARTLRVRAPRAQELCASRKGLRDIRSVMDGNRETRTGVGSLHPLEKWSKISTTL